MKFFETSKYFSLKKSTYISLRWIAIIGQLLSIYIVYFFLEFDFNFFLSNLIVILGAIILIRTTDPSNVYTLILASLALRSSNVIKTLFSVYGLLKFKSKFFGFSKLYFLSFIILICFLNISIFIFVEGYLSSLNL